MLPLALDIWITGGMVWDATVAAPWLADLHIRDGVIVEVGALQPPDGAHIVDATGATILPGLVDSHVHISMDPGAAFRTTTPEQHSDALDAHLRAYLACGVTTILDPAIAPDELTLVRSRLAAGVPAPNFYTLGTPLSPTDGYVSAVIPGFPSVSTVADVGPALDRVVAQGAVGVKTTVEPGFAAPIWEVYSPEVREAICVGAAARGLTVYTHAMSAKHQALAIDALDAQVLVHPLARPNAAFVAKAAAAGVFEISTLAILDSFRTGWEPERLDDPLIQRVVPTEEIETARTHTDEFQRQFIQTNFPRFPIRGFVRWFVFRESTMAARLGREMAALRDLAAAGVGIVMGSDSGNWPVILSEFHGPTSIREMELLALAGFSPAEALTAATLTPARMLKLDATQGTVEAGKRADLVIVEGDPLQDLGALRHVRYTVRAGGVKTPEGWLR